MATKGHEGTLGSDGSVLKLDGGDGCTTLQGFMKIPSSCILTINFVVYALYLHKTI